MQAQMLGLGAVGALVAEDAGQHALHRLIGQRTMLAHAVVKQRDALARAVHAGLLFRRNGLAVRDGGKGERRILYVQQAAAVIEQHVLMLAVIGMPAVALVGFPQRLFQQRRERGRGVDVQAFAVQRQVVQQPVQRRRRARRRLAFGRRALHPLTLRLLRRQRGFSSALRAAAWRSEI